jgi:recombination protein RecR
MQNYIPPFQKIIDELNKLPGIGPKSAEKLASYILKMNEEDFGEFINSLEDGRRKIRKCKICFNLSEGEICDICKDESRDKYTICVVEEPKDLIAIEKTGVYNGLYHVLHGILRPSDNIESKNLKIDTLIDRIKSSNIKELILATNLTYEGELTAMFILRELGDIKLKITRIASGLPVGSDIEYADQLTLKKAFEGREEMDKEVLMKG